MPAYLAKPAAGSIVRPITGGAAYPFQLGMPRDCSGNGIHGTISGGVTRAGGPFGDCPDFNGSTGFIDLGSAPTLNPGLRDMSVALWINVRNTSTAWRGPQKKGTGAAASTAGWQVSGGSTGFGGSAVPWNLANCVWGDGAGNYARLSTTNYALADGWHSVVLTWTNSTGLLHLYLDGVFRETGTVIGMIAGKSISSSRNATIGSSWESAGSQSQFLNGQLDAVMIEFRAWSAAQVRDYHRDPFAPFRRRDNAGLYVQPPAANKPYFFQRHILRNRRAG